MLVKRSDIPNKYLEKFYHPTKIDEIVEEVVEEISTDDRNYLISEIEAECSKPDFDLWTIAYAQESMPRFNKQYFIDKDIAQKWAIYWQWQAYQEGKLITPLMVRAIGDNQWEGLSIDNLIYSDPPSTLGSPLHPDEKDRRNHSLKLDRPRYE